MRLTTKTLLVAASAAAVASPAAAQASAQTFASDLEQPTQVAAQNGTVVWWQYDPAKQASTLKASIGGAAATDLAPEIAVKGDAPQIDIGFGNTGAPVAVTVVDGEIVRINVQAGTVTKWKPSATPTGASVYWDRVMYLTGSKGNRALHLAYFGDSKRDRVVARGNIDSAELGWDYSVFVDHVRKGPVTTYRLRRIHNAGGRASTVYSVGYGGASFGAITRPTIYKPGKSFVFAVTRLGAPGNEIVRYTVKGRKLAYATGNRRFSSTAWGGDELGLVYGTALDPTSNDGCVDGGVQYCKVGSTGPLTWRSKH